MKGKNIHLIVNPAAGKGCPDLSCLDHLLADPSVNAQVYMTSSDEDVFSIASRLACDDDLIAVFGGDGSISDAARALVGKNATLGVIPGGTANVISKEFGIPQDLEEAVVLLTNGCERVVDMGLVNGTPFLLRVNLGIMAEMVIDADPQTKARFGQLAYGLTAIESIINSEPTKYRMIIDGEEVNASGVSLTVTNAGNIGIGDFSILPGIDIADGFLDVVLMDNADFTSLIAVAGTTLFQTGSDVLQHWKCKEITIYLEKPEKYICDDVEKEAEILDIKVIPDMLRVLVPCYGQ